MSYRTEPDDSTVEHYPDALLLQAVWELDEDAIITADLEGRITAWNPGAERVFGYRADEAIGKSLTLFSPTAEHARVGAMIERLGRGETFPPYRATRVNKSGDLIDVSISVRRVDLPDGSSGITAIIRDISDCARSEDALRRSEARFRALIEHASDIITILDAQGVMLYKTPATLRTLGYLPEELIGQSAFEYLHPDDHTEARDSIRAAIAAPGTAVPFAVRFRHVDGHWVSLEGTCTSLLEDPDVGGIVVNSRDVTDRVRAVNELRASEARYRQLFEGNQTVQLLIDPSTGRIVDGNPAASEFYGYTREQLRTLQAYDLCALPHEVTTELVNKVLSGRLGAFHAPHRIANGDIRTVEVRASVTEVEGRTLLHALIHDVTDRLEAEMAVRASESRLRLVLRRLPALVWTTDRELRVTSAEGSVLDALGVERGTVEGRQLQEILRPHGGTLSEEAHRKALRGEASHYQAGWGEIVLSCHVEPLREADGRLVGVVGVAFDVTAQKGLEEQLAQARKMEAVGRLAGGVAHDFNNLLTAIRGSAEFILRDAEPDSATHEDAAEIVLAAQRAAELTHQLLAFSRKQVLQPRRIDLNQTVLETERMLRRLIGEDVALVTELSPEIGMVEADPGQIAQVLMNLAINARDAMPGGGTLTISTRAERLDDRAAKVSPHLPPGTPAVHLCVRDNGAGMSDDVQDKIFEPFFTTKAQGQGTGLGLATVYGIVKQSGGYIWVDSEAGKGSTFDILLPEAAPEPSAAPEAAPHPAARREAGTATILLVEDEDAVRGIAQRMLTRAGYTVLPAPGGDEALRIAGENPEIDLLITDVVMPGMNGRALADRLRETHPDMRVLFMSGYTDDAIVHHGVLETGTEFIQKPFGPEGLAQRVAEILGE